MRTKIIIFISIGLIWFKAIAEPGVISVRGAKVELVELYEVFSTVGQCKIDEARDYYAKVPGNLEVITLKQGNKVRKGEVLLVIDKAIARSIKMQAQAMLKSAEASYKRNKLLYSKKYISNSAFEKAQLEFADTTLNFNKTMDTYNAMVIIAPFDGEIGVIKPKVGDKIQVGDYLFSIVGQDVRAKSILVELPVVLYQKVDNHSEVIVTNNQGDFIYKINNNIAEKLYVKLGVSLNNLTEIISNEITEGDLIVIEGLTKISDGSYVNLLPEKEETN
ncbi:hypothetical protein [Candidatus Tisiphia endosymbiont of Beris chalybata]|uniref:efflux RND transporter periplasmic adaptor subunit n=1 Tax=Candidatus Tisiphia endosymbiont of Beris chalybata TaxID=3066262 RepID=UPI00312C9A69